jgi:hypothetical protein
MRRGPHTANMTHEQKWEESVSRGGAACFPFSTILGMAKQPFVLRQPTVAEIHQISGHVLWSASASASGKS